MQERRKLRQDTELAGLDRPFALCYTVASPTEAAHMLTVEAQAIEQKKAMLNMFLALGLQPTRPWDIFV